MLIKKKNLIKIITGILLGFLFFHILYSYQLVPQERDSKNFFYEQYSDIPANLIQSIISIEDRRFRYHPGIDPIAIARATIHNTKNYLSPPDKGDTAKPRGFQGASTIDQQLIKLSQQAFSRTRSQKVREQRLALNIQFHYSKEEIFLNYINRIPFSHGIIGRKSACSIYFQKSCDLLNEAELSYLLAVSQLGINPYKDQNQNTILERAKVLCTTLKQSSGAKGNEDYVILSGVKGNETESKDLESFVDSSDSLAGINTCSLLSSPNYISLFSYDQPLDPRVQLFLDQEKKEEQSNTNQNQKNYRPPLLKGVPEYSEGEGFSSNQEERFDQQLYSSIQSILTTTKTLRQQYNVKDCCIVVVDREGNLVTMNMCSNRTDPEAGKINLCLEARQTGSAIKPFLYLYAMITKGLKATDIIIDEPVKYNLGNGNIYEPKNFDLKHHGKVTLAFALGNSLNVPAIKLTQLVGVSEFLGFLKEQLQIYAPGQDHNNKNPEEVGLSIGLGTYEISPYAFTKLRTLFLHNQQTDVPAPSPSEAVGRGLGGGWSGRAIGDGGGFDPQSANQKSSIIEILSNPTNKVTSFGQDSFLNTPGRAVKTGTSRKFIDGRVCGVHNEKGLAMCIWMGNYNNEAMKGASSEVASYVWNMVTKVLE